MPNAERVDLANLLHSPGQQNIPGRICRDQRQDEDPGHSQFAFSSPGVIGAICNTSLLAPDCLDFLRSLSVTSTIPIVTASVPAQRTGETDSPSMSQADNAVRTYVEAVMGRT